MNIGPLWCIESNAWLRFEIGQDGHTTAQIAPIDPQNPYLTMPWRPIEPQIFHVFDSEAGEGFQHKYYCLHNNHLYRYGGVNKYTSLPIIAKLTGIDDIWQPEKTNPFGTYDWPTTALTEGFIHPLTPEQQSEKWIVLQKKINPYITFLASVNSEFSDQQREDLVYYLPGTLTSLEAKNYPTYDVYLETLRDVISNPDNNYHLALLQQAAKTTDYDTLKDSPIDTSTLFLMKKNFFFNLLTTWYNHIRETFGLESEELALVQTAPPPTAPTEILEHQGFQTKGLYELITSPFHWAHTELLVTQLEKCLHDIFEQHFNNFEYYNILIQVIHDENNSYHQAIQAIVFDDTTLADMNLDQDLAITEFIRESKRNFFFDVLRAELLTVGQLLKENAPVEPNEDIATNRLVEIQHATAIAQKKYAEWYIGQQSHRGANGFFSWARHGVYGQNRAQKLNNDIFLIQDEHQAIDHINEFFTNGKTRYHRHSFASFLLGAIYISF